MHFLSHIQMIIQRDPAMRLSVDWQGLYSRISFSVCYAGEVPKTSGVLTDDPAKGALK